MNEREIAEKVLTDLRRNLPGYVIIKHNDVGTKGIPDVQINGLDRTSWAELKLLRRGDSLKRINKAQQLVFCHELATVNHGRCWVVVFEETETDLFTSVWQPRILFAHLWPNVAGPNPDHPSWTRLGFKPIDMDITIADLDRLSLVGTVHGLGAVRLPGWRYDIVTRLVKEAVRE